MFVFLNLCSPVAGLFFCLQLTSQHPYAEVYIGQPHVWTVDIENPAEVEKAIRSILSQKVKHKMTSGKIWSWVIYPSQ